MDKIGIITTNDRFVNEEWAKQQGVTTKEEGSDAVGEDEKKQKKKITLLCDGDGDLVKAFGLAEDMGFGVGVRSKRFAMVTENGKVTTLLTDEGMDDCMTTSAENLIKILSPSEDKTDSSLEIDGRVLVGALVGAVLLAVVGFQSPQLMAPRTNDNSNKPSVSKQVRAVPKKTSETTFPLLNEYLKQD